MRTLSARILLGFVALMTTFGIFMATIVVNLREVEDLASLSLRGYVPIALASANLGQREEDLRNYLEQGISDASRPTEIVRNITRLRNKRDESLGVIVKTFGNLNNLVDSDSQAAANANTVLRQNRPDVDDLKAAVDRLAPAYAQVLAAPPLRIPNKTDPGFADAFAALDGPRKQAVDALLQIRDAEREVSTRVTALQQRWQRYEMRSRDWLANTERSILVRGVYLGVGSFVVGLLITAWVVFMLRPLRRLREGARRIAAGDYGKRVSEVGPAEIADLAREFNSMGRAIQEREEEKERAARLAMVGKMAAQIAHEVRNPLSSISLNTELLEDELGDDATEGRELCRAIRGEVNRLTEVTETYLGLRGGKPRLTSESLNTIVEDLVGFVRNDLATRSVVLETELDPGDPPGLIDPNQIRQCLINLVRNAADAVAGKGGGRVVLRTRGDGRRVEVTVEDDGIGIARDVVPRLFDPFFSTKKGGSGLGLALTQQIIRDHGGDIHVDSRVGRGTTFTLSVPASAG
jgi:signal transduction histidine kinase